VLANIAALSARFCTHYSPIFPVRLGRDFENGVEAKSGLDGGETIIISPADNLFDGQPVIVKSS
jgi:hypothetical protein